MKLLVLFLFWGIYSATAVTIAQNQVVSLNLKGVTYLELFNELHQKTGIRFLYSSDQLKNLSKIDVIVRQKKVCDILAEVLQGTGLISVYENDIVMLKKAPQNQIAEVVIKGTVKDEEKQPLPGATVTIKGTTIGVVVDVDGNYVLTIPDMKEVVLVYSFVGMKSEEIKYTGQKQLDIVLREDKEELDEVVVTGYFAKDKSSFTGAVTQITREELQKFGNAGIFNILSQVDPAFKLKENNLMGSDPNTLPEFFIRGEGSFMGDSNLPTFIVDGYEVDRQYIFDMDMDRIESLTILKDASATIYYGSRAANGVIVIETRRPKAGELTVSYSNKTTLNVPDLSDYDLMNAAEKLEFERLAGVYKSDNPKEQHRLEKVYDALKADVERGVDTYWLSQPLRNVVSHTHSVYVSGGDERVTYGLSANYDRRNGVMKKSSRENYGLSFDLTYRIADKLSIRNSLSYSSNLSKNSPYGSFSHYAAANPYSPVDVQVFGQHDGYKHINYLYDAKLAFKDNERSSTLTNNLSIDCFVAKNLRFKTAVAFSKGTGDSEKYKSPLSGEFVGKKPEESGRASVSNQRTLSWNLNTTLSYNLHLNRHNLYAGIGLNMNESQSNGNGYTVTGFLDERFQDVGFALQYASGSKPSSTESVSRLIGVMGNLNYSFDNRYFVDWSLRADGSSKYGADKKFGVFWAIGVGWNIHKEKFMQSITWLEELKIRGSLGVTGNQNFDPNMAKTMFTYYDKDIYYEALGLSFNQYGNPKLEWQKGYKRNIGVDFNVWQRKLSFSFDYYDELTKGLLLPVTVAPSLGFVSYTENYGEQKNQGFEFNLNVVALRRKDWDVALSVSGSHNRNRITKISNALAAHNEELNSDETQFTKPVALYEEGESTTAIKVVRSMGIDPETGKELFLTRNGEITDTWNYEDKVKVGDSAPDLEGNFGMNLMWKQLSLNVNFGYSFGGQLYNQTLAERVEGVNPHANADRRVLEERWQKPGDHVFFKDIADRTAPNASSRFVQDNNYLEMTNFTLSYRFDRELVRRWGIDNLRLAFNMGNLFYVSTVKRERGLDYPFARQFTFSLNLNF